MLYEGYSPISQTISELTANGAPSELAARILSGFFGLFVTMFAVSLFIFFRKKINKIFTAGLLLFIIMNFISAVAFQIFPLPPTGITGNFQDTMHKSFAGIVVVLSIVSLIMLAIGFIKSKRHKLMEYLAIGTLVVMAIGSVLSGAIPSILGIGERICIYALQLYTVALAVFMLKYREMI